MHWAICSLSLIDLYALPFIIRYSSTLATVPNGEPSALNLTADKINGSNIMTHYNLESGTTIWKKVISLQILRHRPFYPSQINFMGATNAMIKNVNQMGIVYMFEESDFFALYLWE